MPLRAALSPLPNGRAVHRKPATGSKPVPATPKITVVAAKRIVSPASSVKDDAHKATPGLVSPMSNMLFSPPAPMQHTGLTPELAKLRIASPVLATTDGRSTGSVRSLPKVDASILINRAIGWALLAAAVSFLLVSAVVVLVVPAGPTFAPPPASALASHSRRLLPPAPPSLRISTVSDASVSTPLTLEAKREPESVETLEVQSMDQEAADPPAAQPEYFSGIEPPLAEVPEAPAQTISTALASPPLRSIDSNSISSSVRSMLLEAASRAAAKAAADEVKSDIAVEVSAQNSAQTVAAVVAATAPAQTAGVDPGKARAENASSAILVRTSHTIKASLPTLALNTTCPAPPLEPLRPTHSSAADSMHAALLASIAPDASFAQMAKEGAWLAPLAALFVRHRWPLYDGPRRWPQHPSSPATCPLVKPVWRNATEAFMATLSTAATARDLAAAGANAAESIVSAAVGAMASTGSCGANHTWLPHSLVRTSKSALCLALASPAAPLAALVGSRVLARPDLTKGFVLIESSTQLDSAWPVRLGLPSWAKRQPDWRTYLSWALVTVEQPAADAEDIPRVPEAPPLCTVPNGIASTAVAVIKPAGARLGDLLSSAPRVHAILRFARPAIVADGAANVDGSDADDADDAVDVAVAQDAHAGMEATSALVDFMWTEMQKAITFSVEAMDEAAARARDALIGPADVEAADAPTDVAPIATALIMTMNAMNARASEAADWFATRGEAVDADEIQRRVERQAAIVGLMTSGWTVDVTEALVQLSATAEAAQSKAISASDALQGAAASAATAHDALSELSPILHITAEPLEPAAPLGAPDAEPPVLLVCLTTVASALLIALAMRLDGRAEAGTPAPPTAPSTTELAARDEAPSPLSSHDARSDIRGALSAIHDLATAPSSNAFVTAGVPAAPASGVLVSRMVSSTFDPLPMDTPFALLAPPSPSGRALLEGAVEDGLYGGIQPLVLFDLTQAAPRSSNRKKKVAEHVKTPPPRRSKRQTGKTPATNA